MAEVMEEIVRFVTQTSFSDLPAETVDYTKILCLSQLAAIVGGVGLPASSIVARHVRSQGGVSEAGVVGHRFKAPALQAALFNATAAHATEMEDDNMGGGSTIGTIIPAVFTLGQARKSSGKDVLESIVVGYDMQVKTATACGATRKGLMGLTTGAWGPAASAAKLLKLDAPQTNMALSIVASLLGGLLQQVPSMTHFLESGTGAYNGIFAALLAKDGYTANPDILEVKGGYWDAMGFDRSALEQLKKSLSDELSLMRVGIKKYGSANITQRLIDAAGELCRANGITDEDVARVEVHVAPWFAHEIKYADPKTADQARFSINHLLAAVLVDGSVTLHTFSEEKIHDARYREARKKVHQIVHEERGHVLYTNGPDELAIRLKNGKEYRTQCVSTGAGRASRDEVIQKFKATAEFSGYLSAAAVERVTELVLDLEQVEDVGEIMGILTDGH